MQTQAGVSRCGLATQSMTRFTRRAVALRRVLVAALVVTAYAASRPAVHAQSSRGFVPVTDAMLQEPSPDDWPMWRRTLEWLGLQPARPD